MRSTESSDQRRWRRTRIGIAVIATAAVALFAVFVYLHGDRVPDYAIADAMAVEANHLFVGAVQLNGQRELVNWMEDIGWQRLPSDGKADAVRYVKAVIQGRLTAEVLSESSTSPYQLKSLTMDFPGRDQRTVLVIHWGSADDHAPMNHVPLGLPESWGSVLAHSSRVPMSDKEVGTDTKSP